MSKPSDGDDRDRGDLEGLGDLAPLIEHIRTTRGFDFSGYKPASIGRRVAKRVAEVGCTNYSQYQDFLEVHPEEFGTLFNTILINVTSFFRDGAPWDFLRDEVVGRLLTDKAPNEPIRVWSAGCASGEEAYSLAMVLADALGEDEFRERVKIYGTDVDEDALSSARHAGYDTAAMANLPPGYAERYFDRTNEGWVFRSDLRRAIIFGRHDLLQDAPISRLDLLVCRNILMYFNADTQARVVGKFHFALRERGFLFLGKAETLLAHSARFSPVDLRMRVFAKRGESRPSASFRSPGPLTTSTAPGELELRETAMAQQPVATVLVDVDGDVVLVNEAARRLLGTSRREPRGLLANLELSYRPVDLRPLVTEAYERRVPVERSGVEWRDASGERAFVDVVVTPLYAPTGAALGVAVTFRDGGELRALHDELEAAHRELTSTYEELQSTNEELETANEELQSTIEELETTNEELQSANEELETTNEELQSTNDQLHSLNLELQVRGVELDRVNMYFGSILTGLLWAVIVVDRDLLVNLWNGWAEEQWGLRADEVLGRSLLTLDSGLPIDELAPAIRLCLDGDSQRQQRIITGRNRRGQLHTYRVVLTPLRSPSGTDGVIMVLEELAGSDGDGPGVSDRGVSGRGATGRGVSSA